MRPMVLMLPAPAIPETRVANSSGAMIDLISRRKIVPRIAEAFAGPGKKAPNATPATSPMMIHVVRDILFTYS